MNPAFEKALQARLLWMQVRSYGSLGFHRLAGESARKAYRLVEKLAVSQARCELPWASPYGAKCPTLLSDVTRLADLYEYVWLDTMQTIEDEIAEEAEFLRCEQEEAEERRKKAEALIHATSCIERNDWESLGLPSPEHLSTELYAGRSMSVDGHFLDYEHGFVWMDNPYGVEGGLGDEPTIQLCREFLITIAKGGMYGPEP